MTLKKFSPLILTLIIFQAFTVLAVPDWHFSSTNWTLDTPLRTIDDQVYIQFLNLESVLESIQSHAWFYIASLQEFIQQSAMNTGLKTDILTMLNGCGYSAVQQIDFVEALNELLSDFERIHPEAIIYPE